MLNSTDEDRYLHTRDELYNKICTLLGGRAAEEIVFREITTGAKDDLGKANEIAQQMVCELGMSDLEIEFTNATKTVKQSPWWNGKSKE